MLVIVGWQFFVSLVLFLRFYILTFRLAKRIEQSYAFNKNMMALQHPLRFSRLTSENAWMLMWQFFFCCPYWTELNGRSIVKNEIDFLLHFHMPQILQTLWQMNVFMETAPIKESEQ